MTRWRTRIAGLMSLVLVAGLAVATAAPAQAAGYEPISGSGSTWSQNALDQWRSNVATNYGLTVSFSGQGSTTGRRNFIDGIVDFAVSEIPFQAVAEAGGSPELPFPSDKQRGYAYMPIVAGGTAFMYHLVIGGKRVTNLRLSGEVITKIFTGKITKWNDPAIKADNPGLALPDKTVTPIVRSDGSGTTAQFTMWMSKQYPALWSEFTASVGRGSGFTSQYPLFPGAKGQGQSSGVAGYVAQPYGEGAITYVETSYAIEQGFPVAKVLNTSDYYVEPTSEAVAVALLSAQINTNPSSPDYLTQILDGVYNSGDPRAYPLSSYSYMIVPTEVKLSAASTFTEAKGASLGTFASYFLCEGQQQAGPLGYSPLPMNLVLAGFEQIKRIPGAGGANVDPNKCNNPTFSPGDNPSSNRLAASAPQPAACDKRGPDQCTSGTAGAKDPTAVSGSGSGGTSSNTAGATTGGTTGTGASATGADVLYDEYGNVIGEGTGTTGSASVVASPYTVEATGWGWQQSAMLGAVLLLLAAVITPPLVIRAVRPGNGAGR